MKEQSVPGLLKKGSKPYKLIHSKGIKKRRYLEDFFGHSIIQLYPMLSFISARFNFDIKELLKLLLENLYNETKIDKYVNQIRRFEDKNKDLPFDHAILAPVLKQYLKRRIPAVLHPHIFTSVEQLTKSARDVNFFNHRSWNMKFFRIKNYGEVKFYSKAVVTAKTKKIFGSLQIKHRVLNKSFIEFLCHIEDTKFLYDKATNKEIENILSHYNLLFLEKMVPHRRLK